MSKQASAETLNPALRPAALLEARATRWAVIAFVISLVILPMLFGAERRPVAGSHSLGSLAAWSSMVFAGVGFGTSYYLESRYNPQQWRLRLPLVKRIADLLILCAASMMLSHLMIVAISYLFQMGFVGLTVDRLGGAVLASVATAATTYISTQGGAKVNSQSIAQLAVSTVFAGTMASMITAPDQAWWEWHFSALGNSDSRSGAQFNLTLAVTGLTLTALSTYIAHDLQRGMKLRGVENQRLITALSWMFAGMGLCMMGVGLVTDAQNTAVHVSFATGMVLLYVVFMSCIARFLPQAPLDLLIFAAVVVVAVVIAALLWIPIGYYNLTGMEFVAASFLFSWLIVFSRTAAAYGHDEHRYTGL
ncbi:DUF998 domain-containing protein [Glutamicibacter sp.]|uniref:DUF998 domain-containing protein n=1 Tax=Glutamicibacter sp. TaxID=1931995 RepID=UPI0028BF2F7C|nr:DUF998 domain-containing protein [Glutamicibacter sp.]